MRAYTGLWSLPFEAGERLLADQRIIFVDHLLRLNAQWRRYRVATIVIYHYQQHVAGRYRLHHIWGIAIFICILVECGIVERGIAQVQVHL